MSTKVKTYESKRFDTDSKVSTNITVHGAANEVTGSCYLLETAQSRLLVDCGLFQGPKRLERLNKVPPGLGIRSLDAVLLTHGHLDHCGRLPLLIRSGYRGPIYATRGTIEIANLILADAAGIQENDTARENRRRVRAGLRPIDPLFTSRDAEQVARLFRAVRYDEQVNISRGITARYVEAGHILGSSCIEIYQEGAGTSKKMVFSGDLGQYDVPIMRDPARIEGADLVVMESTYGDRDHRSLSATVDEFHSIIRQAVEHKGKVLIPTFAVGRTQLILYYLAEMFRKKIVPPIPVYLDSPMAISATRTYLQHTEILDEEERALVNSGQWRHDLSTLTPLESAEESQSLNSVNGPCIILAGAGMCNAGRILHHLKHNLWKPDCYVIIVGYQAGGSVGRKLIEGASKVKIFGETVAVSATVKALGGFSAHAGQTDLLRWFSSLAESNPRVILTHGESHQIQELASQIESRYKIRAEIPKLGDTISD